MCVLPTGGGYCKACERWVEFLARLQPSGRPAQVLTVRSGRPILRWHLDAIPETVRVAVASGLVVQARVRR